MIRTSLRLTYRPLEIIIVDNGSNDGNYEAIEKLVIRETPGDIGIKLVRRGANIVSFSIKSPKCKYVTLINNNLAPEPNSLARLIRWLEGYPRVAGVQGLILRWDGGKTDSYGTYIDNWWERIDIKPKDRTRLRPIQVTYLLSAYSVYRVEALERCDGLFLPHLFVYGDDTELGIRLWRCGYYLTRSASGGW